MCMCMCMYMYVRVLHSLSSLVGLCALSVDNDNGFIAYPGSSQVRTWQGREVKGGGGSYMYM